MNKVLKFLKTEPMLTVSAATAAVSLFITPPEPALLSDIDWHTLGTLLMMLCVLEGFKQENVLDPLVRLSLKAKTLTGLTLFYIFGVFFSSMFVTNDVSLMIFVPLTIFTFRGGGREKYILPVLTLENIAAIRGSLLTPFGSPQNLFLYSRFGISAGRFLLHMLPLCAGSAVLLVIFVLVLYRKALSEPIEFDRSKLGSGTGKKSPVYLGLFALVILTIVSRTKFWWAAVLIVVCVIALTDRKLFLKVDYVLLFTFLFFFIFSSSIAANERIAGFLSKAVAGREYWWVIGLSQLISNVPASIVLYPFSKSNAALIYGADTAGLCSLIGSLASVINYRIYVREYPENGRQFIKVFTLISWAFFAIVVIPVYFLASWEM